MVKTNINDYPWNMYGRISAVAQYTVPEEPDPMLYDVTKPVHNGEAYRQMQIALNAGCYTDDDGATLVVDGKWGKRSRQAFDKMLTLNGGAADDTEHYVTVEIDGCVVSETVIAFN